MSDGEQPPAEDYAAMPPWIRAEYDAALVAARIKADIVDPFLQMVFGTPPPRTRQEILDHADEIAEQFENYEPKPEDRRPAAPQHWLCRAMRARADAEREVAAAVAEMRKVGYSWSAIGMTLGMTGKAVRQKYGDK